MDKSSLFSHKEFSFFASEVIKIGANFCFDFLDVQCFFFEDQLFPSYAEVDLRLCFSLRGQQGTTY